MADYQLGVKDESTYGTAVVVDTFYPFLPGDPINIDRDVLSSEALKPGRNVPYSALQQPVLKGGSGSRSLEVYSVGFEWFLKHMLGAVTANASTPVAGATSHVATLGDLCGDSFTWQENVVMGACKDTDQAMTWAGGKVASWTLSCDTDGILTCELELLFQSHSTGTALATASYPAGQELLSWAHATVDIASTAIPVMSWSLSCNNGLKDDRYYQNGSGGAASTARYEPVQNSDREITFECELDFTNLTQWNRAAAVTASAGQAAVDVTVEGPSVITGSTYPALQIAIPALRFDEVSLGQLQQEMSTQSVSGVVVDNESAEPLTVTYVTAT